MQEHAFGRDPTFRCVTNTRTHKKEKEEPTPTGLLNKDHTNGSKKPTGPPKLDPFAQGQPLPALKCRPKTVDFSSPINPPAIRKTKERKRASFFIKNESSSADKRGLKPNEQQHAFSSCSGNSFFPPGTNRREMPNIYAKTYLCPRKPISGRNPSLGTCYLFTRKHISHLARYAYQFRLVPGNHFSLEAHFHFPSSR